MFSKLASYVLYVVVGITVPILVLFYFGDNLVNTEQYQAKVQKIENPAVKSVVPTVAKDLQSADSLAMGTDSTAVEETQSVAEPVAAPEPEVVSFNFMERLVYYKTDIALVWGYILLLIAALTAVIFPVIYAFIHPVNMVRSLLVLAGVAVLILLAYLLSSAEPIKIVGYTGTDNSNPGTLKLIDTGLIFMYFVLGLALFSILYSEIAKYFK
ncbi:MAG: hypothetical protein H6540_03825 [Bacteroidales bacterium]|nr:hypothetical protein [Bacteroidales bacterium]